MQINYKIRMRLNAECDRIWAEIRDERSNLFQLCQHLTILPGFYNLVHKCIRIVAFEIKLNRTEFQKHITISQLNVDGTKNETVLKNLYITKLLNTAISLEKTNEEKLLAIKQLRSLMWNNILSYEGVIDALNSKIYKNSVTNDKGAIFKCLGLVYIEILLKDIERAIYEEKFPLPEEDN